MTYTVYPGVEYTGTGAKKMIFDTAYEASQNANFYFPKGYMIGVTNN